MSLQNDAFSIWLPFPKSSLFTTLKKGLKNPYYKKITKQNRNTPNTAIDGHCCDVNKTFFFWLKKKTNNKTKWSHLKFLKHVNFSRKKTEWYLIVRTTIM